MWVFIRYDSVGSYPANRSNDLFSLIRGLTDQGCKVSFRNTGDTLETSDFRVEKDGYSGEIEFRVD